MKNLKRIIAVLITLKRIAPVFLLLVLLIVGLSAQERGKGSPRRPRANTSGAGVKNSRLAGTYRLNTARSDYASALVYGATNSLPEADQLLILDGLMSRLESPDVLVIEQRGDTVTIASPNAPTVTFEADGRERSRTVADGRTVRARSTLSGGRLLISSKGDRGSDFDVTFESRDDGRGLDVTRRVHADLYTQPFVVRSFYDRTPGLPAHDGKIETSYDEVKDTTTVRLTAMQVYGEPLASSKYVGDDGARFYASFTYPGRTLSAPPGRVLITLVSTSEDWKYTASLKLTAVVDGKRLKIGPLEYAPSFTVKAPADSISADSVSQEIAVSLPYKTFLRIAHGKKVRLRMGPREFRLEENHLEALRDLAGRMAP